MKLIALDTRNKAIWNHKLWDHFGMEFLHSNQIWLWIVNTQYYRVVTYYNRDKTAFKLNQINVKLLQKLKLVCCSFESSTVTWTRKNNYLSNYNIRQSSSPQSSNILDFFSFIHSADSSVIQLMYTLDIHIHFNSCLLCILSGIF